ncbi:hypothetical protein DLE01_20070 [Streptomyces sp. FT05W]|nr:hypothetical protein DLE01_20070 [Streptomyces sp. FT05W]
MHDGSGDAAGAQFVGPSDRQGPSGGEGQWVTVGECSVGHQVREPGAFTGEAGAVLGRAHLVVEEEGGCLRECEGQVVEVVGEVGEGFGGACGACRGGR